MKRADLEKYLGKDVEIKLFDDEVIKGYLRKTQDEMFKHNPNLYFPKNWYFVTATCESKRCISVLFRVSHIKSFKEA